jgi:hypothetical protein
MTSGAKKIQTTKHVFLFSLLTVLIFVAVYPFIHFREDYSLPWRLFFGFLNGLFVLFLGNLEKIYSWLKRDQTGK